MLELAILTLSILYLCKAVSGTALAIVSLVYVCLKILLDIAKKRNFLNKPY